MKPQENINLMKTQANINLMKVEQKQKIMCKQTPQSFSCLQTPLKNHNSVKVNGTLVASHLIPSNNEKNTLKCGIDCKYLSSVNYLSTCEFSKKRNFLYKLYSNTIRDYYSFFNFLSDKFIQKINPHKEKYQKLTFLREFNSFIHQFGAIFKQVSLVQISYFQNLEQDISKRQYSLQWNTNQFIDKLQRYKKSQQCFEEKSKIHTIQLQEIYQKYDNLKKDEKDAYSYFNRKNSCKKANDLIESLKKQNKTRQTLRKGLDEVYENSGQFQSNLILYRQQLFNNKYKIMKKLSEISKISRNSLTQFLVYLFECVCKKSQNFAQVVKTFHDPSSKRTKYFSTNQDKLAIESYLIQVSNQYNRMIEEIQGVIRYVSDIFEELRKFTTTQIQIKRKILQLMNTLYDVDENPDNEVSKTLNFYQEFCTKIFQINNGMNIATNQLAKLKKEAKKLAEITLSLVRNSKFSQKGIDTNFNQPSHHTQIEILLQKLTYHYPVNLIQNIYKDFQKNLTHLKNDASQKFHMKKRRLMDSMEISHFDDQTLFQPKKRICKKEVWLWEKWQNQINYKIDESKINNLSQIQQFASKFIIQVPEAHQNDRFSCSLECKGQPTGFFILTNKYLKFETSQGNCILLILLQEVEEVKIVVKMFGKIISINTTNGTIQLRGCMDPQRVFEAIQEVRNNSGVTPIKTPRLTIQVTVEELAFIEQRKKKIKSQLPKLQQFSFVQEAVIKEISIDHLYELIYSEKEVNIRGKIQPNFFSYTSKKNGASNYQFTKYDSIGPRFYTHQQGVTFLNCPVFSMRIINYDVKLPPVPFMPKYAHNREECKLFWISNEQFYYFIHNNTSGAPKADTFFLEVLHKVERIDQKSTKIAFYWRIVFSEDSYLKSTIQSSAASESKKGIAATLADIQKYCKLAVTSSTGQNKGSEEILQKEELYEEEKIAEGSKTKGVLKGIIELFSSILNKLFKKNITKKQPQFASNSIQSLDKKNSSINILLLVLTVILLLNFIVHLFSTK